VRHVRISVPQNIDPPPPPLDRVCLCDRIVFTGKEQSFQLTSDDVIIVETIAAVVLREDDVET
jgi:hypothetical protein